MIASTNQSQYSSSQRHSGLSQILNALQQVHHGSASQYAPSQSPQLGVNSQFGSHILQQIPQQQAQLQSSQALTGVEIINKVPTLKSRLPLNTYPGLQSFLVSLRNSHEWVKKFEKAQKKPSLLNKCWQ